MLIFVERGRKTGEPGEKPSEQGKNQQQAQPTYDSASRISTRVNWWEASALTTAPTLPSSTRFKVKLVNKLSQ